MKLTVLGSASATIPKGQPFRFHASHLVETDDMKILFDVGIGVLPQLHKIGLGISDIDVIVVSHMHPDHFTIMPLLQTLWVTGRSTNVKQQIKIIGPTGIEKYCRDSFEWAGSYKDQFLANVDADYIEHSEVEALELSHSLKLSSYKTDHFGLDAYVMKLEKEGKIFAYSGDSTDCDAIRYVAKDADIFLCEAALSGRENNPGHLSSYGAGVIAKACATKKLVLAHYSGLELEEDMVKDVRDTGFSGEVDIAKDLSVYEI